MTWRERIGSAMVLAAILGCLAGIGGGCAVLLVATFGVPRL